MGNLYYSLWETLMRCFDQRIQKTVSPIEDFAIIVILPIPKGQVYRSGRKSREIIMCLKLN